VRAKCSGPFGQYLLSDSEVRQRFSGTLDLIRDVCKQPVNLPVQRVHCFAEGSVLFGVNHIMQYSRD
jgi:hypothetical protein